MTALKLDMQIPVGDAGRVCLLIDIADISQLSPQQRQVLADTGREFLDFAAATLTPPGDPRGGIESAADPADVPATVHDPNGAVLAGVTGSRIREKL